MYTKWGTLNVIILNLHNNINYVWRTFFIYLYRSACNPKLKVLPK